MICSGSARPFAIAHDDVIHAQAGRDLGDLGEWHRRRLPPGRAASSSLRDGDGPPAAPATDAQAARGHAYRLDSWVPHRPRQMIFVALSRFAGISLDYGIEIVGSTTAQNAHFGLPTVSNSSGRLVRVTGKELSQV